MAYYDESDPDLIEARRLLDEMPSTHLIDSEVRKELRRGIAEELYGSGSRDKGRRAFILMGPPGAGKSTMLTRSWKT